MISIFGLIFCIVMLVGTTAMSVSNGFFGSTSSIVVFVIQVLCVLLNVPGTVTYFQSH